MDSSNSSSELDETKLKLHLDAPPLHGTFLVNADRKPDDPPDSMKHIRLEDGFQQEELVEKSKQQFKKISGDVSYIFSNGKEIIEQSSPDTVEFEKDLQRLSNIGTQKTIDESFSTSTTKLRCAFFLRNL